MEFQNKKEIRKHFLEKRKSFSKEEIETRSDQIVDRLFSAFVFSEQHLVHTYLPIEKFNEINTYTFISRLWKNYPKTKICSSISDFEYNEMHSILLEEGTELTVSKYGIPEPKDNKDKYVEHHDITHVLIPMLAYDRQGHRTGYGKGFYDRFLAKCSPEIIKIGLSFFEPLEYIPDLEPTDITMDICITPEEIHYFS